jgi:hypothetical protein
MSSRAFVPTIFDLKDRKFICLVEMVSSLFISTGEMGLPKVKKKY